MLRNPSNAELARLIGLPTPEPSGRAYDLLIVGGRSGRLGGRRTERPKGLATAVLLGRRRATGGQAGLSARIENYLGFPAGLSGAELAERAVLQAEKFRAELAHSRPRPSRSGARTATTRCACSDGVQRHDARRCSDRHRRAGTAGLPVPDVERFEATSVYYAATLVEAHLCVGEPVIVVGGGNSAGQAAVFLAARASTVRLVVREPDLAQACRGTLIDRLSGCPGSRSC